MKTPERLKSGDLIEIVAPSASLGVVTESEKATANAVLESLGLRHRFSRHASEMDDFRSSSVVSRVVDLHAAFADPEVKAVVTVTGGFNSNELLSLLDWDLIAANPKVFCGFSDITALCNAITTKAGFITYLGPGYSALASKRCFEGTLGYLKEALFSSEPFLIGSANEWASDRKSDEVVTGQKGLEAIHEGEAEGRIVGGNLTTLNMLQGTPYFPDLRGSILFLEDDEEERPHNISRSLQSLVYQPGFSEVRGIVFGRFQPGTGMTSTLLNKIIENKPQLKGLPIIAGADFGHTVPLATLPIGGTAHISGNHQGSQVTILR